MTGCMYVAPVTGMVNGREATQPLVIADTVVTNEGIDSPHFILPTNATPENEHELSKGILYRKVYILENLCAVAFSGDGTAIRDCYSEIVDNIKFWLMLDRPMAQVQNAANRRLPDIEVVGGAIKPKLKATNYITPPGRPYEFEHLGTCFVTGNGRDDLLRSATQFNQQMIDSGAPPDGTAAHWFAIDANAIRLAEEVNGNVGRWGGYLEYAYLNRRADRWERGPRTLHVFMNGIPQQQDRISLEPVPRIVAYDPGPDIGRLVSVLFEPKVAFVHFSLRNLLQEGEHTNVPPEGFWEAWKPQAVTITVIVNNDMDGPKFINRTLQGSSMKHFEFSLDELGPYYKISKDVLNDLGTKVAIFCGRQYDIQP